MDCPVASGDAGKGRQVSDLKISDDDGTPPAKIVCKTDSQSTEEALDPDAPDFVGSGDAVMDSNAGDENADERGDDDVYFRPRSESPDVFRSSERASNLNSSYGNASDGQHHDTAPTSPTHRFEHAYEVEDSRDEVRSECGGVRARGRGPRGRGRGAARPCSGSATPVANSPTVSSNDKKRAGRGRGSKRGRGYGLSRTGDVLDTEFGSSVPTSAADDVYEFKSSPESEFTPSHPEFGNRDERERSVPPTAKRQRLTDAQSESHGGSAHSGDIEMDDIDEDDGNSKLGAVDRKTPSSAHLNAANRKGPRGRHGKRHNDTDEAQRMTRSKVRQTGKVLDDADPWSKKKRGRVNPTSATHGDEVDESTLDDTPPAAETCEDPSPPGQTTTSNSTSIPEALTSEQRVIYENPRTGMDRLKKMLAARWVADLRMQQPRVENEKYKNMLLLSGDYALQRPECPASTSKPTGTEKTQCKQEVKTEGNSTVNGEAESEDESNTLCPEMKALWKEHNEERTNMLNRMYKERVKLRLFWEQELLRLDQREKGTSPAMCAVRFLRENEMCNAQILEEQLEPLKAMNRTDFAERKNKSIMQMFNRHKMEASSLFGLQRDMWLCEARRRGIEVNAERIKEFVPMVIAEKTEFPF
ncbi:hypothetical protein Q1695_010346 [Nippostrongylus brasiliensis]|nr:hypothetical protein Q1695_010346 [Nippostrongylus brasiliensis]